MINKIIGSLVVIAVGILLSPFFFKTQESSLQSEAMAAPPFPRGEVQSQTQPLSRESDETPVEKPLASTKEHAGKLDKEASAGQQTSKFNSAAKAWVVQVGSFSSKRETLNLVNQLRAQGYNAFFQQKKAAYGEATEVYIGPELKLSAAQDLSSKLAKDNHLFGIIQSYKVLSS